MLKIRKFVDAKSVVFALSGRIEGEHLPRLESLVKAEAEPIVLDLKEVILAGRDAVRFLADCEQGGARLKECPAYMLEWIAAERGKK